MKIVSGRKGGTDLPAYGHTSATWLATRIMPTTPNRCRKNAISDKSVEGTIYRHAVHDVLWDITMVDTFEEYKEDLTLHCKRKYLADVQ